MMRAATAAPMSGHCSSRRAWEPSTLARHTGLRTGTGSRVVQKRIDPIVTGVAGGAVQRR